MTTCSFSIGSVAYIYYVAEFLCGSVCRVAIGGNCADVLCYPINGQIYRHVKDGTLGIESNHLRTDWNKIFGRCGRCSLADLFHTCTYSPPSVLLFLLFLGVWGGPGGMDGGNGGRKLIRLAFFVHDRPTFQLFRAEGSGGCVDEMLRFLFMTKPSFQLFRVAGRACVLMRSVLLFVTDPLFNSLGAWSGGVF